MGPSMRAELDTEAGRHCSSAGSVPQALLHFHSRKDATEATGTAFPGFKPLQADVTPPVARHRKCRFVCNPIRKPNC
jgi:hypothetical protein